MFPSAGRLAFPADTHTKCFFSRFKSACLLSLWREQGRQWAPFWSTAPWASGAAFLGNEPLLPSPSVAEQTLQAAFCPPVPGTQDQRKPQIGRPGRSHLTSRGVSGRSGELSQRGWYLTF